MTTFSGSCHCGRIAFAAEGEIGQAMDCNCSMCRRRGSLLWFVPRVDFRLNTPPGAMGTYTFNTHRLHHHFCPTCGIAPFSEGTGPDGRAMAAVNVRCLEGVEIADLKIVTYDGRSV